MSRCHVSTRKGLFTLERGAGGWKIIRSSFVGDNVTLAMHDPRTGDLIAALNHGHFGNKLHRSRDGGATWTEIAAPKYPEKPEGYTPKTPVEGAPLVDWSLKLVWALQPGGVDQPGIIWCGTLPGGLFRSDDGGDSWTLNRALWDDPRREEWFGGGAEQPGIHSICVDPRDSRHVTVGVSCGGVWTTRDAGRTWSLTAKGMRANFMPPDKQFEENVQDPHMVAQCRSNPDVLWVQHHNGIFKSTDGAASWTELTGITPSSFGFAVAAHPTDPEHRLVRARHERRKALPDRRQGRRQSHARWRQDVRDHHPRAAAGARLRSRLSPRARCRRSGPDADVRIDDRIGVGERRRGRFVDRAVVESAAGLCGRVRKSR